jgi:hypothetical protein
MRSRCNWRGAVKGIAASLHPNSYHVARFPIYFLQVVSIA